MGRACLCSVIRSMLETLGAVRTFLLRLCWRTLNLLKKNCRLEAVRLKSHSPMGRGKKTKSLPLKEKSKVSCTVNSSTTARNLTKKELGAVIFGCKNHTFTECVKKMLFGLPAGHSSYVKNISPGLTLFLFNYSDRKLHGIFEATSCGKMNIDPRAWITNEGSEYTPYAAQVQVAVRRQCQPLHEEEFKPIIAKNYYSEGHFWFELDREQTRRLTELFSSSKLPEKQLPRLKEQFKNIDSKEYSGRAETSLKENEHSYPIISNRGDFAPDKKWADLFKASSSSSSVEHGDILASEEGILNASVSYHCDMDSKVTSSSQELIEPLPGTVAEYWEEHATEEMYENKSINLLDSEQEYDSTDVPSSDNSSFLDREGGELKSLEFKSTVATVPGQVLLGTKQKTSSGNFLPQAETCERDHNQPNLMGRPFLGSSVFDSVITKLTQELEELRYSQLKQMQQIDYLQQQLIHSELEIDELKRRLHKLEYGRRSSANGRHPML